MYYPVLIDVCEQSSNSGENEILIKVLNEPIEIDGRRIIQGFGGYLDDGSAAYSIGEYTTFKDGQQAAMAAVMGFRNTGITTRSLERLIEDEDPGIVRGAYAKAARMRDSAKRGLNFNA